MKRKFISIFIALVLALSLCLVTAVPVAAVDPNPLSGYEIITSSSMAYGDGGWGGWSVPAGKVVLGGGFYATAPVAASAPGTPDSVWPHYTYGSDEYGWVVRDAPDGVPNTITIYAICADEPAGYGVVTSAPLYYSDGGWAGWSAPNGKVVLGGGFVLSDPWATSAGAAAVSVPATPGSIWPHYTYGADEYGWCVRAAVDGVSDPDSRVYAIYADEPAGYGVVTSVSLEYGDGGWAGWSVPAGKVVLGGGFNLTGGSAAVSVPGTPDSVWPHYIYGPHEYGWVVRDAPDGASSYGSTVYAIYASLTEVWVDDDWVVLGPGDAADGHTFGYDAFAVIQDGIDAVAEDGTVNVAPGIYNEDVTIDKELTLNGAQVGEDARGRTKDESHLTGSIKVTSGASDVTIDGFKVTTGVCCMTIGSASATIMNNIVVEESTGGYPTNFVELNGVSNADIKCNDFSGRYDAGRRPNVLRLGIIGGGSTVTVANNEMHDIGGGGGIGIMCTDASAVIKITDNVIDNTGDGIWTYNSSFDTLLIADNDILNNAGTNQHSEGPNIGINIAGGVSGDVEIHDNNIEGNELGVYNDPSNDVVNATNNYWGHPSGPKHNPGLGDPVSGNVLFNPWLLELGGDTYNKTLALNIGWTLVSTDNWISAASVVGEDATLVVNYIPGQEPGKGWSEVLPDDLPATLVPVEALYVKTVEGGGLGINYSGGVPIESSKDLVTGWNLISSTTIGNAKAILSPLCWIDVGDEQGVGLATLVSQGDYNQHTASFTLATLDSGDWDYLGEKMLNPFDGYWVYMNAAKIFGVVPD